MSREEPAAHSWEVGNRAQGRPALQVLLLRRCGKAVNKAPHATTRGSRDRRNTSGQVKIIYPPPNSNLCPHDHFLLGKRQGMELLMPAFIIPKW